MLYKLKRHPFLIRAHFDFTLVLTYAFPAEILKPLLPPGLTLDNLGDLGFVAIALVKTRAMRPDFLPPWLGKDFFLSGYRIFSRLASTSGHNLRGLRILRSDTDSSFMALAGNLFTHYQYQHSEIAWSREGDRLTIKVTSPDSKADLALAADLSSEASRLPQDSCFKDEREARKYAGPLPFTFNYEKETNSIVRVEGVREDWHPRLISVDVSRATFFNQAPFAGLPKARFASAFYLENVPYHWKPGVVEAVSTT